MARLPLRRGAALAVTVIATVIAGCDPSPQRPGPSAPVAPTGERPLSEALLTPAEVPPGYRPAEPPSSPEPYGSEPAECGPAFNALEIEVARGPRVVEARANFATPGNVSRIQHIIRRYGDGPGKALAAARRTIEGCSRFVVTYPDSTQFEVTTDIERRAEDGFDAAVHLRAAAFAVEERLLVRTVGDSLVVISLVAPEPPGAAVAEGLMATAVGKLRVR